MPPPSTGISGVGTRALSPIWAVYKHVNETGVVLATTFYNQDIGRYRGLGHRRCHRYELYVHQSHLLNQDIGGWDVSRANKCHSMFHNAPLSTANYDALLIGWDAQSLHSGVTFDGGNSNYCTGEAARTHMINSDGWTITDGGKACPTFTITASAGTGGSIDPSGAVSVDYGADQSFTITPGTGYHVADVLVDGTSVGAVTTYTFENVAADHTIAASFAIDTHSLTVNAGTAERSLPRPLHRPPITTEQW